MSNFVQNLRKNRYYLVLFAMCLVLLVRVLQIQLPEMTTSINEDEIHHNFWLIQDHSIRSHFVVAQLQPLLDYAIRLYFWFPLFSFPLPTQYLIILASFLFLCGLGWALRPDTPSKERKLRLGITLLLANAAAFLLASWLLLDLLPRTDQGGLGGFSLRSWGLLLFTFLCGVLLLSKAVRLRRYPAWINGVARHSLLLTASSLLAYAGMSCLALLVMHRPDVFPLQVLAIAERGLPTIAALALLAASAAALMNSERVVISLPLAVSLVIFLGLIFKPFGDGAHYSELALKLPSLFFGILGVMAAFALPAFYFRKRAANESLALLIAFVCSLWLIYHPFQIAMSGYARHYTFASFISLLWFWSFTFGKPGGKLFSLVSFLMINAHFFAIPLILVAYAFDAFLLARAQRWHEGMHQMGRGIAIVLLALVVNFPVTEQYIAIASDSLSIDFLSRLTSGVRLFIGYIDFLTYSLDSFQAEWVDSALDIAMTLVALLFSLVIFLGRKKVATWRFLALIALAIPASLIILAGQSGFAFYDRYFAIYIGLGLAFIGLVFEVLNEVAYEKENRTPRSLRSLYPVLLVLVILPPLALGGADLFLNLWKDAQPFDPIPKNASRFYRTYSQLKELKRPLVLIVNTPGIMQTDIPRFYLDFVDGGNIRYEIIAADLPTMYAKTEIEGFLQSNPDGVIVLDWLLSNACDTRQAFEVIPTQMTRIEVPSACVWYLENVRSYEEVCEAAMTLAFPPSSEPHFCSPNLN